MSCGAVVDVVRVESQMPYMETYTINGRREPLRISQPTMFSLGVSCNWSADRYGEEGIADVYRYLDEMRNFMERNGWWWTGFTLTMSQPGLVDANVTFDKTFDYDFPRTKIYGVIQQMIKFLREEMWRTG